jgi:hypothetical protein
MNAYRVEDEGGIEILAQACAALDRAEALAAAIERDGAVVEGKDGPRCHPACKEELAARAFVVRGIEKLGLNLEAIRTPGRPPKFSGWTP